MKPFAHEPFNLLSPAEVERLALLLEEMGEASQIIGKILRHGYAECNPFDEKRTTNRELLEREIGDVQYVLGLMARCEDIDDRAISDRTIEKAIKIKRYLHHNRA